MRLLVYNFLVSSNLTEVGGKVLISTQYRGENCACVLDQFIYPSEIVSHNTGTNYN